MKKKERVKDPDKIKKRDNIFTIILSICDVVAVVVLFLLYGPFNGFRDFLVTTAMSTMNHQYFATTFYSDEYINKVLARHSIKEPDGNTDISAIIGKEEEYIDDYDREILDRNEKEKYKYGFNKMYSSIFGNICTLFCLRVPLVLILLIILNVIYKLIDKLIVKRMTKAFIK